ncbi:hypothetical protein ACFS5N_12990 [Mucilaginibacter ximonensis]|uniref:Uncharacterized protein n=1 Tax=Mucilaginibacter ximonensis TaxID=538021 RepID=A0ABW5YEF7_9SPHI
MRVNPAEEIVRKKELEEEKNEKVQKVTRIVALGLAFVSVFFFIIKILFL